MAAKGVATTADGTTTQKFAGFGKTPVYSRVTESGFHHRVYIMFHGTSSANAASILREGSFRNSIGGTLGPGVYVTREIQKSQGFAGTNGVIFKLLVYPGKVLRIGTNSRIWQTSWQEEYSSAWLPSHLYGGMEENCIKDSSYIHILGVCRGYENLSAKAQKMTRNVFARGLSRAEKKDLKRMVRNEWKIEEPKKKDKE